MNQQTVKATEDICIQVGRAKIEGGNSGITYISIIGLYGIIIFYIYAKHIHKEVKKHVNKVRSRMTKRKK